MKNQNLSCLEPLSFVVFPEGCCRGTVVTKQQTPDRDVRGKVVDDFTRPCHPVSHPCHPELDSGSRRYSLCGHPVLDTGSRCYEKEEKMLKRVQHDKLTNTTRGFTLIELLVVVLIIGILAAVALPQYDKAVMKSRYATLMAATDALAAAEEAYFMENGEYTDNFESLAIAPSGCTLTDDKKKCNYSWGSCSLNTASDDAVACVNRTSLNNGYARYFQLGKYKQVGRACWSFVTDEQSKYSKLCEQVGGSIYYTVAGCPPYGGCLVYQFK